MPSPTWEQEDPVLKAKYEEEARRAAAGTGPTVQGVPGMGWGSGAVSEWAGQDIGSYRLARDNAMATPSPTSEYAGAQRDALERLRDAAAGGQRFGLAADYAARMQSAEAMQQQAALAASARGGPGALAAAQRAAAFGSADAAGRIAAQQDLARTQEMTAARNAYAQTAGGYSQADIQRQLGQRQINAGRESAYLAGEEHARDLQAGQETGYQARLDARTDQAARDKKELASGMMQAGATALGVASDTRAKEAVVRQQGATAAVGALLRAAARSPTPELPNAPLPSAPAGTTMWPAQQVDPATGEVVARASVPVTGDVAAAQMQRRLAQAGIQVTPNAPAPAVVSDERAKAAEATAAQAMAAAYDHGSPPQRDAVGNLLQALARSSSTYEYKSPSDQPVAVPRAKGQRFAGVMAQDLERVPELGPGLVSERPDGTKQIEGNAALSALLAAVGRQQQQLNAIQEDPRYRHTTPRGGQ